MKLLRALYAALLRLYPEPFRREFGAEMLDVYARSLRASRAAGPASLLGWLLRETFDLPASLAREHWYALYAQPNLRPSTQSGLPGNAPVATQPPPPPRAWEVLMAALPFLLFGLLMSIGPLVSAILGREAAANSSISRLTYLLLLPVVVALPLSLWKHRQIWTASWYIVYVLLVLMGAGLLFDSSIDPQEFYAVLLALGVAFLLYYAARAGAVRGLLAGLPFALAAWQPFLESTPHTLIDPFLQGMLSLASWVMLGLVAALATQTRRAGLGLALALGTLALAGFGFACLGIYQGGMLPFSEPGPSLRVAGIYAARGLLLSAAILLGPQLARCLRAAGFRAGALGRAAYRLALLGMVLLIAAVLLNINANMYLAWDAMWRLSAPLDRLLYAGLAVYHVGYVLLLAATWRAPGNRDWFSLALLYGLILAVLPAVFLGWPPRTGQPALALWQITLPLLAWMALSVLVVAHTARQDNT